MVTLPRSIRDSIYLVVFGGDRIKTGRGESSRLCSPTSPDSSRSRLTLSFSCLNIARGLRCTLSSARCCVTVSTSGIVQPCLAITKFGPGASCIITETSVGPSYGQKQSNQKSTAFVTAKPLLRGEGETFAAQICRGRYPFYYRAARYGPAPPIPHLRSLRVHQRMKHCEGPHQEARGSAQRRRCLEASITSPLPAFTPGFEFNPPHSRCPPPVSPRSFRPSCAVDTVPHR